MITCTSYKSPVGELLLGDYKGSLCLADWKYRRMRSAIDKRIQTYFEAEYKEGDSPLLKETILQLDSYFQTELKTFEIPLAFAGTEFQKKCLEGLAPNTLCSEKLLSATFG